MNKRFALSLLFTAALAGCTAVGPDYQRPTVDAPSAFIYAPRDAAETANTAWWKQFNDPVLDSLIAEALLVGDRGRHLLLGLRQLRSHVQDRLLEELLRLLGLRDQVVQVRFDQR